MDADNIEIDPTADRRRRAPEKFLIRLCLSVFVCVYLWLAPYA